MLKSGAVKKLRNLIDSAQNTGSVRLFSIRHEFPTEWAKFKSVDINTTPTAKLSLSFLPQHYPFWAQDFKRLEEQKSCYPLYSWDLFSTFHLTALGNDVAMLLSPILHGLHSDSFTEVPVYHHNELLSPTFLGCIRTIKLLVRFSQSQESCYPLLFSGCIGHYVNVPEVSRFEMLLSPIHRGLHPDTTNFPCFQPGFTAALRCVLVLNFRNMELKIPASQITPLLQNTQVWIFQLSTKNSKKLRSMHYLKNLVSNLR